MQHVSALMPDKRVAAVDWSGMRANPHTLVAGTSWMNQ